MDAIKKFFKDKKADAKFKKAGKGHMLTESWQGPGKSKFLAQSEKPRGPPSVGSKQAGAAALARAEQSTKSTDVKWNLKAIQAQARRELEAEQKLLAMKVSEGEKAPEAEASPKMVSMDSTPMLAVQGIYFHCPLIGSEVASYNETKDQIRQFLYDQLEDDKGISSCLIIHTCNKNKEKVSLGVETLRKYLQNLISDPSEEKYRKIRTTNKIYQERVEPVEGAKEFLEASGFELQDMPFNDETHKFWVFPDEAVESKISTLEVLCDALLSAEPLKPQLHRNPSVLLPQRAAKYTDLPDDFFALSADELRKEMQLRADAVERSMVLRTKAMREKDELREMRKYRFTLVRIRFPDGFILQGTFAVHEKFSQVLEFIREHLYNDWRPFWLSLSSGGKITEEDCSMADLKLVPAVMLNFEWDSSVSDPELDDSKFLKEETLMLVDQE